MTTSRNQRINFAGMTGEKTNAYGVMYATAGYMLRTDQAVIPTVGIEVAAFRDALGYQLVSRGLFDFTHDQRRTGLMLSALSSPYGEAKCTPRKGVRYYKFWQGKGLWLPWWIEVAENCPVPVI